jgi:hypothetical protein
MLRISINGKEPVLVKSVVMFDDSSGASKPIAACMFHANVIFFADSVRDAGELSQMVNMLGFDMGRPPELKGIIQGSLK